jgi:hypothetical protein
MREGALGKHSGEAAIAPVEVQTVEQCLIVPPEESSAMPAQRFVRSVLVASDVDRDVINLSVLMTKALIINGILRARSGIAVRVKVAPESIRIEVADEGSTLPWAGRSWGTATMAR